MSRATPTYKLCLLILSLIRRFPTRVSNTYTLSSLAALGSTIRRCPARPKGPPVKKLGCLHDLLHNPVAARHIHMPPHTLRSCVQCSGRVFRPDKTNGTPPARILTGASGAHHDRPRSLFLGSRTLSRHIHRPRTHSLHHLLIKGLTYKLRHEARRKATK
jgi:hypothetical protein